MTLNLGLPQYSKINKRSSIPTRKWGSGGFMKLCLLIGTRPEIIKMWSIAKICEKRHIDYYILHTGQHYSYEMDRVFFEELDLPAPKYNLKIGSNDFRRQVGVMKNGITEILKKDRPEFVLVVGDTNSVLSGGLASHALRIPLVHIEAGLRSHEIEMTEETNRIITDHISQYLFAPSETSRKYLLEEGINRESIFVVGNTIVDAVHVFMKKENNSVLNSLKLESKRYMLLTLHRPENVDLKARLAEIFAAIGYVFDLYQLPIVFPLHPRTRKMILEFDIDIPQGVRIIQPVGYIPFLDLQKNARIILTDSGGIQEEACTLGVPCVTLRTSTERPETIEEGCNILAGIEKGSIVFSTGKMMRKEGKWNNPYGAGNAAEKIIQELLRLHESS